MKRIFVCSPFQGKYSNVERARRYCKYVVNHCHAPFAPHLIYPQFLSEGSDRELGMGLGMSFLEVCDEVWTFRPESEERTDGMQRELKLAVELEKPILYFIENNDGEIKQV